MRAAEDVIPTATTGDPSGVISSSCIRFPGTEAAGGGVIAQDDPFNRPSPSQPRRDGWRLVREEGFKWIGELS
jgi:hypothetical protein